MIDDMVTILVKEQADDEKHKTFCQAEFAKADTEEKDTSTDISSITSAMADISDEMAGLSEDIKTLKDEIASLDKSVAEATEQRKEEHADYTETLALTETAIELIAKAKNRLQKFYNPTLYKAAPVKEMTMEEKIIEAGTFAQVRLHVAPPPPPETFGGAYEKKSEKSGGVLALMDELVSDLEADMKDSGYTEKTAQKEYAELMTDSQATRAQDAKSIVDKEAAKATMEAKLITAKTNHAATKEEISLVTSYIGDLHVSCDFIMQNFDLRVEARTAEIESLKNAKAVLSGASFGR